MKWNGTHKLQQISVFPDMEDQQKSSEQVEIEQAVNAIKKEASSFEEEFNQQQQFSAQVYPGLIKREHLSNFNFSQTPTPQTINKKFQPVKITQYGSTQFAPVSSFDYEMTPQTSTALPTLASMSSLKTTEPNSELMRRGEVEEFANIGRKKCGRPKS